MPRSDIEFTGHGGTRLRGWLYASSPDAHAPAVVMTHGLSATKEMALDDYAAIFAGSGLTVLLYDHRNLGASDGEPRQQINPWAQARDYRYAIEWLADRPEADGDRIGVWGSSFSGGEVLVLAACDERIKAVVANAPFAALGGAIDYGETSERFEALRKALLDESGHGPADDPEGPELGPLAVVEEAGNPLPAFLPQSESAEWFLARGGEKGSRWQNRITLKNAFGTDPAYDPGVCADHIAPTPLLMVVASEDRVAPAADALAAFERAEAPKQLVEIEGHHFAPYAGPALQHAASAARDFFLEHL